MTHDHHHEGHQTTELPPASASAVKDPVCGMTVEPETAAGSHAHAGHAYHFCRGHCLEKLKADPGCYLGTKAESQTASCCGGHKTATGPTPKGAEATHSCCHGGRAAKPATAAPPAPVASGTKYTCPMHPGVVKDGPGTCPKCGMALEPMMPVAGEEDTTELDDMTGDSGCRSCSRSRCLCSRWRP